MEAFYVVVFGCLYDLNQVLLQVFRRRLRCCDAVLLRRFRNVLWITKLELTFHPYGGE